MKVLVDYPTDEEEFVIVERVIGPPVEAAAVATTDQLAALQAEARRIYVDPSLIQYAVKLVSATRTPEKHGLKDMRRFITFGASPRATIGLIEGARALAYAGSDGTDAHWAFIRLAQASVANTAIYPVQDLLGQGSDARMNVPGTGSGNWTYRYPAERLTPAVSEQLRELSETYERIPGDLAQRRA
jgi:MoxR-like ATPase